MSIRHHHYGMERVEKEPEVQPEDSNEVIIQTKEEDIEEQPIETDPAEEFFQQVVEKKENAQQIGQYDENVVMMMYDSVVIDTLDNLEDRMREI